MILRLLIFVFLGLLRVNFLWAQNTLLLQEVQVLGVQEELYAIGTSIESIGKKDRVAEGSGSLNDLLNENTSIFLLQYGAAGQLASINMRGLGPARSSLLWNGMEINSFSLGQSDYNLVASTLFDDISIQYGSVASLFGNGALGGSISLGNNLSDVKNNRISIRQTIGSFSNYQSSASIQLTNGKLASSTKGYYQTVENDFPYDLADSTVRQQNAAYENYGVMQDFLWSINEKNNLNFSGWYNYNFREIQPSKTNLNGQDELEDENWRTKLTWSFRNRGTNVETSLGFTDDRNLFNGFSEVRTRRYFLATKGEKAFRSNLIGFFGINWNHLRANATNYNGHIVENRNDFFGGVLYSPSRRLDLSFTARQPMVDGNLKAFSPTLGADFNVLAKDKIMLDVYGNLSRSFRLPTLNDRFWNPGGNLGLQAEEGRNFELGTKATYRWSKNTITLETNYFYHWVENWILWRPGGVGEDEEGNTISFWFPENLREVRSQGLEVNATSEMKTGSGLTWNTNLSSTFTRSINLLGLSNLDRSVGKQLPFTPEWNINFNNSLAWKRYRVGIHYSYTGERFVEANNELDPLPAFSLVNVSLASVFNLFEQELEGSFRVNNLFNVDYESFENRAMPGINYELTLQLTIQ